MNTVEFYGHTNGYARVYFITLALPVTNRSLQFRRLLATVFLCPLKRGKMDFSDYGFTTVMNSSNGFLQDNAIPARVTAVHKEHHTPLCEYGDDFRTIKKRKTEGLENE